MRIHHYAAPAVQFGLTKRAPWVDLRSDPDPRNEYSDLTRQILRPGKIATIYADDWGQLNVYIDKLGLPWARWERKHPNIVACIPITLNANREPSVILIEQSRPNSDRADIIDLPGGLIGDHDNNKQHSRRRLNVVGAALAEFIEETGIEGDAIEKIIRYKNIFPTIGATNELTHYVGIRLEYDELPEELLKTGKMKGKGVDNEGEDIKRVYLVPLHNFRDWFNEQQKQGKQFGASVFAAIGQLLLMENPKDANLAPTLPIPKFGKLSLYA